MQLSSADYFEMKENPAEFCAHDLDAIKEKKSKTFRSNSTLLLYKMCQNIDGFLFFFYKGLWEGLCQTIHSLLAGSSINSSMIFESSTQARYFLVRDIENMIATRLLSISTLNPLIKKRRDLRYSQSHSQLKYSEIPF